MAGSKISKPKDDPTKKRKRDLNETDARSKRSRQPQADSTTNGDVESEKLQDGEDIVSRAHDGETGWRLSKPMGGRMLDIDPILTPDDQ